MTAPLTSHACLDSFRSDVTYFGSVVALDLGYVTEDTQVVVNSKGTTLAAADDSGSVCLINLEKNQLAKTLRNGHTNVRS